MSFVVNSPHVTYDENCIVSSYEYQSSVVTHAAKDTHTQTKTYTVTPTTEKLIFKTQRGVPRVGLLLVGWGGNNGTTVTAGVLANRLGLSWRTKEGLHQPDYLGSLTQASVVSLGLDEVGQPVHVPLSSLLPMAHPNDLVLGGWDISDMNLADAMYRAKVLDYDLMRQLEPHMKDLKPMKSIYNEDFIALNQKERVDNAIETKNKAEQVEIIRNDIRSFKAQHSLDKVLVLWTATTERFVEVCEGLNDTAENMLKAIQNNESEISPSNLFAVASILEGCSYINGSPQNTFVPGIVELSQQRKVFVVGDDFKSGQTKMKSVLVDFLVSAGLKPASIVSYNHLGNNDGMNLSAPQQFRSKEITKSNVVDDMVASNNILYKEGEHPDHVVVIKYVPYVGDSKRAMDEYTSEIFLGGKNTIVMHNTCEDSLLASPLIYDLCILTELCERISVKREGEAEFQSFHTVLSLLAYLMKAPLVPPGTPVVNALAAQRQCIVNVFKACVGLPPDNFMTLEHKIPSFINRKRKVDAIEDAEKN